MYTKSRAGATLSQPVACSTGRGALLFRPNHDHEQADSINGNATAPQPLSMTVPSGERRSLAGRFRDGLRCGDSGAVLEKAAVEVKGVALSNEVHAGREQHGNSAPGRCFFLSRSRPECSRPCTRTRASYRAGFLFDSASLEGSLLQQKTARLERQKKPAFPCVMSTSARCASSSALTGKRIVIFTSIA